MAIQASGERSSTLEAAMTKVFAVAVSILTISLGAVAFTFTTIDVKAGPLSVHGTAAQGINNRGDVVGFTLDKDDNYQGYLTRKGVVTFIQAPFPGRTGEGPRSINESGDIVGEYYLADYTAHGFLRSHHGEWTRLVVPGATESVGMGINGPGEIVGVYSGDGWNSSHGFLFRPGHGRAHGSYLPIDYPGANSTEAYGINDDGDVVGIYYFGPDWTIHGFLQHDGDFTTLDVPVPGAQATVAHSINSRGEIDGQFWGADGVHHGFLLSKGTYTTFDAPGLVSTWPLSFNDHGEIVGCSPDEAGVLHSFKAVRAHH
jgi:uncharacterized membrane protein